MFGSLKPFAAICGREKKINKAKHCLMFAKYSFLHFFKKSPDFETECTQSAIHRNEALIYTATRMNLANTTLRKRSQTHEAMRCVTPCL